MYGLGLSPLLSVRYCIPLSACQGHLESTGIRRPGGRNYRKRMAIFLVEQINPTPFLPHK